MRKWRWLYVALLCLWVCFIFSNSLKPGPVSAAQSGRLTEQVVRLLEGLSIQADPGLVSTTLRKLAHAAEFFVLGLLACLVASASRYGLRAHLSGVVLCCMTCGLADEFLQLFVMGRSGEVTDVIIDSLAGLTALLCGLLWTVLRRKRGRRS